MIYRIYDRLTREAQRTTHSLAHAECCYDTSMAFPKYRCELTWLLFTVSRSAAAHVNDTTDVPLIVMMMLCWMQNRINTRLYSL
jgi:hypothetical protein